MSDRGRGAVAVLVTALAAVALAAPAQGAYPGRNGLLAVVSSAPQSGGCAQRIDLIRLDSTRVRRIPCPRPCGDLWPVWSPDGRRLAFNARVDVAPGGLRIGVVHATGADRRILPSPEAEVDAVAPAWSPDAMRLAFGAVGFSAGGIWTSDLRGLDVRRLSAGGDQPAWSAGGRIAYAAGGPAEIWTMGADGSDKRRLTRGPGEARYPEWAPGGRRIAFTRIARGRESIWIMRADGSRRRRLTTGSAPAWSPDGRRIAFERRGRIFVTDLRGRRVREIPFAPETASGRRLRLGLPDWQPVR
jgi:TolB protein